MAISTTPIMLNWLRTKVILNARRKAGQLATKQVLYGENDRDAVAPVHTRFDHVQWFVWDAEKPLPDGGLTACRQVATLDEAIAGLE